MNNTEISYEIAMLEENIKTIINSPKWTGGSNSDMAKIKRIEAQIKDLKSKL